MNKHIYAAMAARRRMLGLSQEDVALLAGLRREKVNRVENQRADISFGDLCKLLDAVGLELVLAQKVDAQPGAGVDAGGHELQPRPLDEASFFDGARAEVLDWGKVPR